MTKFERELLLTVAEALANPFNDVVSGVSWRGERTPKAELRDLIDRVRSDAATDVTPNTALALETAE